jgi:UDP-glucose 4-epimerase
MKVLVTGIAGRLGSIIARQLLLAEHEVFGIDMRPWLDAPAGVEVINADLRKRTAEEVFRLRAPDAVVHMATMAHLHASPGDVHRISLGGTKAAIDYCDRYGIKQAVFVGRHTYYGASADTPLYHTEDEPPMASDEFPELADLVAADLFAGSALWRYPNFKTCILRLCYTLGPSRHGTLGDYLRGPKVLSVLGFDPLFQFMHEADAARAVLFALQGGLRGVFNVAGPSPLPLSTIIEETGRERVAIPEPLFSFMSGKFGLPRLPGGAKNHLKYPIVIDASAFRKASGFVHEFDEYDTLRDFCAADFADLADADEAKPAEVSSAASKNNGSQGSESNSADAAAHESRAEGTDVEAMSSKDASTG